MEILGKGGMAVWWKKGMGPRIRGNNGGGGMSGWGRGGMGPRIREDNGGGLGLLGEGADV